MKTNNAVYGAISDIAKSVTELSREIKSMKKEIGDDKSKIVWKTDKNVRSYVG